MLQYVYKEVRVTEMPEQIPPNILSTKYLESAPLIQAPGVQSQAQMGACPKIIQGPRG
jgi:hypothetical protein